MGEDPAIDSLKRVKGIKQWNRIPKKRETGDRLPLKGAG